MLWVGNEMHLGRATEMQGGVGGHLEALVALFREVAKEEA